MPKAGSLEQFNKEVDAFSKGLTQVQLTAFQKKIALEAIKRIVEKTPVDTGRARANWQVTIGNPTEDVLEVEDQDGSNTISKGSSVITTVGLFDVIWISNNVDYIRFLEEGSSTQAPEGMVALTFEELLGIFP